MYIISLYMYNILDSKSHQLLAECLQTALRCITCVHVYISRSLGIELCSVLLVMHQQLPLYTAQCCITSLLN